MSRPRAISVCLAAVAFGAVTLAAQTLVLRRFLWRFESTETGVALFLSCWLFWTGAGAAAAATPPGRRLTGLLARCEWLPALACAALYFVHYALVGDLRGWLGIPDYQAFPLLRLALGCLLANAPLCFVSGWGVPALGLALARLGLPAGRAFAGEALGAAVCGAALTALLAAGVPPDPRDAAEWFRYFPQAAERPGRFETGGGTTLHGTHGGTFYALTSGGVSEVIPEGDRAVEQAALALSQRPYAASALLLGRVPLATALALESLRPDLAITWCPADARYGEKLLAAVATTGLRTRVRAAGETPHRFLERGPEEAFDLVVVLPPPATSLGGAAWRDEAFARAVRRVTRRSGAALFGLALEGAHVTPEKAALLEATVRPVRLAWPEGGCLAAGAGGWWIAARAANLAYGADAAPARFALLKRHDRFPTEAVALLYNTPRARRLAEQCPVLDPERAVLLPETARTEEVLAAGLADALRTEYPDATPGAWFAWLKENQGPRLLGLLLVLLWMAPVALGGQTGAPRRLWAAWLAACGALGMALSLAVLYRLQIRFGSLYLLAGAGSSLYLGGLFLGNLLGERLARRASCRSGVSSSESSPCRSDALSPESSQPLALRVVALALPLCQAGVACGVLLGAERLPSAWGVVALCLAAGCAAGVAVPFALASGGGRRTEGVAGFVLADELGAALAGLALLLLVPLAGLWGAVLCFAALAAGLGLCAAACGSCPRLAAGLALAVALVLFGGRLLDHWPVRSADGGTAAPAASERLFLREKASQTLSPRGIPRKLDERRIRDQMREGKLATNEAAFWE
jgi:hypothetical protein